MSIRTSLENTSSLSIWGKLSYFGTLLAILIVAIPQGTVQPWHRGMFVAVIAILGILSVADRILNADLRIAEPRLLAPLIGIIGLAVAQILPIILPGYQLSLDPYQTQSFILVFGGLIVCTELLFNYTRNRSHLRYLVGLVLLIAIGSSLFGLVRNLVEGDAFAVSLPTEKGFAQFGNRNHFALLAEMGFGLLTGILLKAKLDLKWRLLGWIGCALLVYSIIAANSRGGLVGLTGMAIFGVFVHVMTRSAGQLVSRAGIRRSPRFKTLAKFATAATLCFLTFGIIVVLVASIGGDAVATRIEQIDREIVMTEQSRVNRAAIWESTLQTIRERQLVGSGFGAYSVAITKHDSSNGRFFLEQAHNDYLEIVANGGIIAAVLFAVFAIIVGLRVTNNMRVSHGFRRACCFGAIIGMIGVLIHSSVDFGLHVLVNALVFALLIVIGTSEIEHRAG